MRAHSSLLTVALAVAVTGLAYQPAPAALFPDDEEIAKAVKGIASAVASGKSATKEAKALAEKADLEDVMAAFKPKDKGGFGAGAGAVGSVDGIEALIQALAKKEPDKATVKKGAADWVKAAEVSRGIAEVADFYANKHKAAKKDPKKWKQYDEDMKKTAEDFAKAAKSEDPAAIHKAAKGLNDSCINCHADFR